MKAKNLAILVLLTVSAAISPVSAIAQQAEKEIVVYTVDPAMNNQNDENKIKTNLRFEKGVNEITTDLKANTVRIVFDTRKADKAKIEAALKQIGYTPAEIKPE